MLRLFSPLARPCNAFPAASSFSDMPFSSGDSSRSRSLPALLVYEEEGSLPKGVACLVRAIAV